MKNTKEIATEYRMVQWAEIMRRRTESGTSIRMFCRNEGIHPNRYHYWQRRLREAALSELQPREIETSQLPPAGWAQLSIAEASEKEEIAAITIEIGKCRVRADDSTDTELLTKVCKVLVSLC